MPEVGLYVSYLLLQSKLYPNLPAWNYKYSLFHSFFESFIKEWLQVIVLGWVKMSYMSTWWKLGEKEDREERKERKGRKGWEQEEKNRWKQREEKEAAMCSMG